LAVAIKVGSMTFLESHPTSNSTAQGLANQWALVEEARGQGEDAATDLPAKF
jgi:hypothetical protein